MKWSVGYLFFRSLHPRLYLKVNFDGSVWDTFEGTRFIIKSLDSRLVAAGGSQLFSPSVSGAELQTIWTGIIYARYIFWTGRLHIEDNSSIIIGWIQSNARRTTIFFCSRICGYYSGRLLRYQFVWQVYHKVNLVADRIVFFVIQYFGKIPCMD